MAPQTLTPDRTLDQRRSALAKGNEIRSYRAELKRSLKHDPDMARYRVAAQIMDPSPRLLTMRVVDLLRATPKIGPTKAMRMLRRADCPPSKTLGGLTMRQRLSLNAELLS